MQNTLLGLAIAIILALVAALVAPLVIDWSHYRSVFEEQATRLTGLSVHVNGAIDARLLPTPLIKLRNIEVGEAGREPQLRARALELEVGLGSLLRGEVKATELHLVGPQINLGFDRTGTIDWPRVSPALHPETFSISRFNVEDGRIVLSDTASGSRLVLQKLWFSGDIRSFLGPFRGEGAFVVGDELFGYRISGSRAEGETGLKIRLGVDPTAQPLTAEVEGTLTLDGGVPQFEGTLALARPVGATLSNGQRIVSDPWHVHGKLLATPASASLRDVEFQYGPDERAINFNAKAELKFGGHPHVEGTIAALQVDLDRALASPDLTHRPPLVMAKSFVEGFVAAAKLPVPAQFGVAIEAVTVGGTTIQSLHGDMRFDETGWSFDHFDFRAPGFTEVNFSGRLAETPQGVAFIGPATLQSADVDMLLAWLNGRSEQPAGQAKTLSARGDLTVATDRLAVDRLTAVLDQQNVEGRLAYSWAAGNRPPILDADLRAGELDLDALATFGKTAVADQGLDLPREVTLALDVGKVTLAGVGARAVKAKVRLDAGILQIDRLSIGNLAGAAVDISGRVDELSSRPRGRILLGLDAAALDELTNVLGRFAPKSAEWLRRFADRLAPTKLHGVITVDHAATGGNTAHFELGGQLGLMRVALNGDANGEPSRASEAAVRIDSRLDADDGGAITGLLGLGPMLSVDQLPGRIKFSAAGPVNGDLQVDGLVTAGGLAATAKGAVRLNAEPTPMGNLKVQASVADLRPLHQAMTGQPGAAVPVSVSGAMAVAGGDLAFTDLSVAVGKTALHGRLSVNLAKPVGFNADIAANDIDVASVLALLAGLPSKAPGDGALLSSAPLGAGAFAAVNGAVTFKLGRAVLTDALAARDLKGIARIGPSEIAFEGLDGGLAGGRVAGTLVFRRASDGLAAHASVEVSGADAATVLAPHNKAMDGTLTVSLQGDGVGASPAGLLGALHGSGTIALADAHFAGFAPAAFEAAMRAADQSGAIEAAKIHAVVDAAMTNGRLAVPRGNAALTISGAQINLSRATLPAQDGSDLALTGLLDLRTAAVDAQMTLSVPPAANALIPMRPELTVNLKGPVAAPVRTLDTSALTGFLTLRAAELQTRRLESIEANRRAETMGPPLRPESPVIRSAARGSVVESEIPPSLAAPPVPGPRGYDRLQPEITPPTPDVTRSDSGSVLRSAPPAAALPPPKQLPLPTPRPAPQPDDATAGGLPPPQQLPLPTPRSAVQPDDTTAADAAAKPQQAKRRSVPQALRSTFDLLFGPQD